MKSPSALPKQPRYAHQSFRKLALARDTPSTHVTPTPIAAVDWRTNLHMQTTLEASQ